MDQDNSLYGFGNDDGSDLENQEVKLVNFAGRNYAVGLIWNSVQNPRKASAEAKQTAASEGINADLYAVWKGQQYQYALGWTERGHKAGLHSLAAHCLASKGGSWLGAFPVDDGYYIVAIKDDNIHPECDRFFTDEHSIRDFCYDLVAAQEWDEVFVPDSWHFEGTKDVGLADLLVGRPPIRLSEVNNTKKLIKIGGAVGLGLAVVFGFMQYMDYQEQKEYQRQLEEMARRAQEAIVPKEPEIVIPPMPWEEKTTVSSFIESCVSQMEAAPLTIPGWEVVKLVCDDRVVAAQLERSGGTINWIADYVNRDDFRPSIIPLSSSTVSLTWPLENLEEHPVELDTTPIPQVRRYLVSHFEEQFVPINFKAGESNEFYEVAEFEFEVDISPLNYIGIFEAIPGATINRIDLSLTDWVWNIEGQFHEQKPLPQQQAH